MPVDHLHHYKTARTARAGRQRYGSWTNKESKTMFADDDHPKPKKLHEIGCDLTFLSADEIEERIALLHEEIERLEADKSSKTSSRTAAEQFFKSK